MKILDIFIVVAIVTMVAFFWASLANASPPESSGMKAHVTPATLEQCREQIAAMSKGKEYFPRISGHDVETGFIYGTQTGMQVYCNGEVLWMQPFALEEVQ